MSALSDGSLRILVLAPIEPYPVVSGWRTVIYNDIKYLARRGHKIDLLAITYDRTPEPADIADIAKAEYFYRPKQSKVRQVIANLGQALPYSVKRHHHEGLLARASEFVGGQKIDVILIEDVVMAHYSALLKQVAPVPTYLRAHNVVTAISRRHFQSARNPVIRWLSWRQFLKFRRFESEVMDTFDCVSQISPADADQINKINPHTKSHVLFCGVDLDYFCLAPVDQRDPDTIIHVGSLTPITKLPAMIWFYKQVLPRIRKRHPHARLELVGMTPPSVLHQADPREVVVHGVVADVRPHLAKGAVFICPQFVGSGIRVKILTAMAAGCAIVCTAVAAEGLPVRHGHDIFITDGEQQFADFVSALLEDPALRNKVGQQARATVKTRFAWPRIAEQLEMHLHDAIRHRAQTA